jgi:hypothetical protein
MLDLDGELRLDTFRKQVYKDKIFNNSYATIGKGSVSRNKDSCGTHVFDSKQ